MQSGETRNAHRKIDFQILPAVILLLCALLASCAAGLPAPPPSGTADRTATFGPETPSAAPAEPEGSAALLASSPSPVNTPAETASPAPQALTATPTESPAPAPTPEPTATPASTPEPAPSPTPKPAQKTAAKKTAAPTARPEASPKPTATASSSGSQKSLENQMISLVNGEREQEGLKALTYDSGLRAGALKHSKDMSANDFFDHTSPTYGSFSKRLSASGVSYTTAGENIAMYGSISAAHKALMNSSGHRANILGADFTRIGIGIVYNAEKKMYYITQWFAG